MNVRQILAGKPSQLVKSIDEDSSVQAAAERLSAERIGALIVTSRSGKPGPFVGIVSERDIVRGLAGRGAGCLEAPVSDLMTREVVCAAPDDSIDKVLGVMTERRFRHLPVAEDGRLLGMVSIGDAVKARIADLERENEVLADWIKSG